jgi:adenosylcobinamide-GDP ribazoletransferase
MMISCVWITGAFHEDGLADCLDGFGGGWQREQILRIMKDSRSGAFAVIGLVLYQLLKFSLLTDLLRLDPLGTGSAAIAVVKALIVGQILSRCFVLNVMHQLPYLREDELSKCKPIAKGLTPQCWRIALTSSLLITVLLVGIKVTLYLILVHWFVSWQAAGYFMRRLTGYTGDCLGAVQQVGELACYATLLLF